MAKIHPTALVEDGATLGDGVEIGPFCHIGARVTLGGGVRLLSKRGGRSGDWTAA